MNKLALAMLYIGDLLTPAFVYNLCMLGGIAMIAAGSAMLWGAAVSLIATGVLLVTLTLHVAGVGGKA